MDRRLVILSFLALGACAKGDAPAGQSGTVSTANGAVGTSAAAAPVNADASPTTGGGAGAPAPATGALSANQQGKIPVLEYHVIGGEKNAEYTRTAASYRADLEAAYKL